MKLMARLVTFEVFGSGSCAFAECASACRRESKPKTNKAFLANGAHRSGQLNEPLSGLHGAALSPAKISLCVQTLIIRGGLESSTAAGAADHLGFYQSAYSAAGSPVRSFTLDCSNSPSHPLTISEQCEFGGWH